MDREEILDEINKTKEHLANMEKILKECEYERWKPKDREEYFYVDDVGCIQNALFVSFDWYHKGLYQAYDCFKTEKEAQQEAEKILVRRQLEDIAKRLNKGEEIDWFDSEQPKHCIELFCNNIITNFYFSHKTQGTTYCLDKNFLDVAKREIGEERLKKYLRGE